MKPSAQVEDLARVRIMASSGELRRIRMRAGLSSREIGHEIGVPHVTVHSWETGLNRPHGERALALLELVDRLAAIPDDGRVPAA